MDLHCPTCHQPNTVDPRYAGYVVNCGHCRTPFTIPHPPAPPPPAPLPPPPPAVVEHHYHGDSGGRRKSRRSRVTYVLLALFFGCFGVHNFYAGRSGVGMAQLLITCLSFCTLSIVTAIWSFVELFAVTEDAEGRAFR